MKRFLSIKIRAGQYLPTLNSLVLSAPGLSSWIYRYCALLGIAFFMVALAVAEANFTQIRNLALSRYGQATALLVDKWEAEIEHMKSLPDEEKLAQANRFFNSHIRWTNDTQAWGKEEYWATPLELLGRGMGDCEDYAIAKYLTLVAAGVDIDKLRITYVKARLEDGGDIKSTAHMVLAYYPSPTGEPVILDNLVTNIKPASQRSDLIPVYGFNSKGIWVGHATTPASTQPGAKLSRWRDLLHRASTEGLG
jgi:predicted transglutaminase-like cysteine proteinase